MTEQECSTPGCSYPRPEGQWVCRICVQAVERDLGSVPALLDELHTTMSRQDRIGASGGRRGAETSLPWKETAAEALWGLVNTVMAWAREYLPPDEPPMPDAPAAAARWLLLNLDVATRVESSGAMVDEVSAAVRLGMEVIDRPPDLLVAGQCGFEGCEEVLYARPDGRATACRSCGAKHSVAERRAWMMAYAADMALPAPMALAWVRLLMGKTIPRATWDSWVRRERIAVYAQDSVGGALFRFGDVRDLAADWVARPRSKETAA